MKDKVLSQYPKNARQNHTAQIHLPKQPLAVNALDFTAEHPQEQHVEKDMRQVRLGMGKSVSDQREDSPFSDQRKRLVWFEQICRKRQSLAEPTGRQNRRQIHGDVDQ